MKLLLYKLWGWLPIPINLRWWFVRAITKKYLVGVVAVIPNARGELLLFRHTYRGRYSWGLPSGWLEPYEDPYRAIEREVLEETGLIIQTQRELFIHNSPFVRRVDLFFLCAMQGGTFHPSDEVNKTGWFSENKLPVMMDAQEKLTRKIFRIIKEQISPEDTRAQN